MFEILTICTGNICRSPLAELLLRTRLARLQPRVGSAGTMGQDGQAMTTDAQQLAVELGVPAELAAAHRARYLTETQLKTPDLVLAMSREHRRRVIELAPAKLRVTFTAREFGRLAASAPDDEIAAACAPLGADASARARAALAVVAAQRGIAPTPADPAADDVIDPYRQPWETYQLSATQLLPAIDQAVRVFTIAMTAR